jgi:molybdate transport system substrate-binding protein
MKSRRIRVMLGAAVLLASLLTGCQSKDTTLDVLAAASLRDVFPKLATQFEADHDGGKVAFSFGPSGTLAAQVKGGAPADVLATASETTMKAAGDTVADPVVFTANSLAIAVSPEAKTKVTELSDLAKPDVSVALCEANVPCGATAKEMLAKANLTVTPATYTLDVTGVLTTVESDDVDAGVVYRTDVLSAGDRVVAVEIPASSNVSTAYPIATVKASEHSDLADEFVALVRSADGQKALAEAGFDTQ